MTRLNRELRPALTATEMAETDDVYRHAFRRDIKLRSNKPVKAVIRCNQLDPTFAACQWTKTIETTAIDVVHKSKVELAEHLLVAHPYLAPDGKLGGIAQVIEATWVNLRDIGS